MKRINFILMAVMMIFISSCAPTSDIDDLQDQIDALKSGKIASVEQQISSIQASIVSLQSLEAKLKDVVSSEEAMGKDLSSVKSTIEGLQSAISDLKKYIDDEIGNLKSWESVTFVTLEKYQEVLNEIADIKKTIMTVDIDAAIEEAESSMKTWVSELLTGYCTIAEVEAKLQILSDADADMASSLERAKSELTEAYAKAISEAISKYDGDITVKIAEQINGATDSVQERIDDLEKRITAIEEMVQSISFLPTYSDGSLEVTDGILDFWCIVTPENALMNLQDGLQSFSLFTADVQTKAPGSGIHPFYASYTWFDGYVELNIKFDITSCFPLKEGRSLSVALGIFSGITNIVSSFVPVTIEFTSAYDSTLLEKIGSYIWKTDDARYEFDFVLGTVVVETTPGKRAACNYYWFEDIPTIFNDEPDHYLITFAGPFTDPYDRIFYETISIELIDDRTLSIKNWLENAGGYELMYEQKADRYMKKTDYHPELVKTSYVYINSPAIDKAFYGGYCITSYCPLDGTERENPFASLGSGFEYVYAGFGKGEDYEGIDVKDKCVIVDRGEITFGDKCANASNAGAAFVLCVNYDDTYVIADLGGYEDYPFCMISKSLGDVLKGAEDKVLTLTVDEYLGF